MTERHTHATQEPQEPAGGGNRPVADVDTVAASARLRAAQALAVAPAVVEYVRSVALSGRVERGEVYPDLNAPLKLTAVDDCDLVFAQLLDWVDGWAADIGARPPRRMAVWATDGTMQGFRAGTTPAQAFAATRALTSWLITVDDRVSRFPHAVVYWEDVGSFVHKLNGKYPRSPRPSKPVLPRPCPLCGEVAVQAAWFSEFAIDVRVRCEVCWWEPGKSEVRSALKSAL